MKFTRKKIRLKNFDYRHGFVYFITICTYEKQPLFKDTRIAELIIKNIEFRISQNEVIIYCYCIMPDHIHLLLSLSDSYNKPLGGWVSAFKRYIAKAMKEKFNIIKLWQANFYDHVIRDAESMQTISEYILNNPVRKGIVEYWEDYPFSKIAV
jgi:REP-associated tyrosine transposase